VWVPQPQDDQKARVESGARRDERKPLDVLGNAT